MNEEYQEEEADEGATSAAKVTFNQVAATTTAYSQRPKKNGKLKGKRKGKEVIREFDATTDFELQGQLNGIDIYETTEYIPIASKATQMASGVK